MSFPTVLSRAPNPSAALARFHAPASYGSFLGLRTRRSASLLLFPTASAIKAVSPFFTTTARHTAPISTIMSARGKKRSSAAATTQPSEPQPPHLPDTSSSSVTPSGLRRSSRRAASRQVTAGKDKGAGTMPNLGHLQEAKSEGKSPGDTAKEMDKQVEVSKEGVVSAMQGLSEMESSFKRDVKRRKLQVEASVFETSPGQAALFPPRISRQSSDALRVNQPLPTPELDPCDADDKGWEPTLAFDGAELNEESPEEAENGARRPPAVDSSYLPLPWKGRLGYVGEPLFSGDTAVH